ncbi:transporter, major facilitator domain protein [Streptococcus ictaluri 707-05]|uniref:Transporter, major facilitator domain protein n=1 Tax=Streptococcus ictaluri 707-05 TaxID=764299 RepID=G5K5Z6_9STRE|nr:transporter, major facilitator domain protein [Streptococcus ictaluri 707-05]
MTKGMTANQAIKTQEFYLLWFMMFVNVACGLGLISAVAPMAQDLANMSAEAAAVIVGIMGIFNGFGRLLWAGLSDYIGRPLTFVLLFIVNIVMIAGLLVFKAPVLFVLVMAILMTCYGAGFSLIPPYLSDVFGAKELASLHGYILTSGAVSALVGPMLLAFILDLTQSYTIILVVFILLHTAALGVSLYLRQKLQAKDKLPL